MQYVKVSKHILLLMVIATFRRDVGEILWRDWGMGWKKKDFWS